MVSISIYDLYNNIKAALMLAEIENYRMEAALIIEKLTGYKKHELSLIGERKASIEQLKMADELVKRRKSGEPLQYILGEWEFYGLNFKVGQGVLIPRQDTETIIDLIIEVLKDIKSPSIIDLCSGSGCIAITLDKTIQDAAVFAVEFSSEANSYLSKNIKENDSDVKLIVGNVLKEETLENFLEVDCIVSNPPYLSKSDMNMLQKEVTFEPEMALFGGDDGLKFYREITKLWSKKLKPQGVLVFEIGINQHDEVKGILESNGYKNICFKEDLCGIIRVVYGYKV